MPRKKKVEASKFSKILNELMFREKMTNIKAGRIAGVSSSTVSDWRQGASPSESIAAVKRLADHFGVSLSYLLLGEEQAGLATQKTKNGEIYIDGGEVLNGVYQLTLRKLVKG